MQFSAIHDLISPATLRRIAHYAEVVKKTPRAIIDRELNEFMDEKGDYTMQQLAMLDENYRRAKRRLQKQDPTCISSSPAFHGNARLD